MARLYDYFGFVGIASILCWLCALVMLVGFFASPRRTRLYLAAFGVAFLGYILALANSHNISQIEVDRSEEIAAAREHQRAIQEEEERAKREAAEPPTKVPRFAEETIEEAQDKAGQKAPKKGDESPAPTTGTGAAPQPATSDLTTTDGVSPAPKAEPDERAAPVYGYRKLGKKEREEGKEREVDGMSGRVPSVAAPLARTMPEADVVAADRFDRLNLFAARLVPWLALMLIVFDYLSRFNKTTGYLVPLPIAGRIVDALFPKTHAVLLHASTEDGLRRHLADAVRKGETFVYLGPRDLWHTPVLYRLPLRKWNLWGLERIVYPDPESDAEAPATAPDDSRFILDALWFGRYCFVMTDEGAARSFLSDVLDLLERRRATRAAAWRAVHLVWAFDPPLPGGLLSELVFLCRETNFKLTVVVAEAPKGDLAAAFEEQIELAPEPAPHPTKAACPA